MKIISHGNNFPRDSFVFRGPDTNKVNIVEAIESGIYLEVDTPIASIRFNYQSKTEASRKMFTSKADEKLAVDLIGAEIKAKEKMVIWSKMTYENHFTVRK